MIKRKLMMVERIMYVDSGTPLNCVFTAKIKGTLHEADFKTALEKIQKKHSLLRSRIDTDTEQYPFFIEEREMEAIPLRIIDRESDEDWLRESEKEWFRMFEDHRKPLAQLVWIKGNEVSEILWVLPHCICDGTSQVTLMRELLCLLDDPTVELDTYQAFSSVDDFLPSGFNTKKKVRKARLYLLMARLFFLMQKKSKKRNLGKNYVIHWKLNPEITNQITSKCKAHGVSVHSLLCASFMQAFQEIRGAEAKRKVISPVDVRHFIPEIKQDHVFAFAPTIELSLKKGNYGIFDQAGHIKKDLLEKLEKIEARELLWMGEQMHPLVERMISMLKSTHGGHDITLSNMGKINIPDQYQRFELETIMSPTVAFPWLNSNTLVTTTYKQEMDFTLMSNEDFLSRQKATEIKDKALELLTVSLQN